MGKGSAAGKGEGAGQGGFVQACATDICDLGRHVACCVCCLMCTGPILLLVGLIVLLSAANNTRGHMTDQFNNQVNIWNSGARATFAQAQIYSQSTVAAQLTANTNPEATPINNDKAHSYSPLRFSSSLSSGAFPSINNPSGQMTGTFQLSAQQPGATALTTTLTVTVFNTVTLTQSQLSQSCTSSATSGSGSNSNSGSSSNSNQQCSQVCANQGGTWTYQNTCLFQYYMNGLCTKLALSGTTYSVSTQYGGAGCFPCELYDGPSSVCSDYSVGQLGGQYGGGSVSFTSVNAEIRSDQDPYILAAYLTNGSFNWGLTTAQKIAIAIVLLVIGGVFCFAVYGGMYFFIKCIRNRDGYKGGYQRQQEPVPSYGTQPYAQPYTAQPVQPYGQAPYQQPQYNAQPQYTAQPQYAAQPPAYNPNAGATYGNSPGPGGYGNAPPRY